MSNLYSIISILKFSLQVAIFNLILDVVHNMDRNHLVGVYESQNQEVKIREQNQLSVFCH